MADTAQESLISPPPILEVCRVAGQIGAEIRNVALSGTLDDATISAIRQELLRHKVIFFRNQNHLDDAGQEAFAERMGAPIKRPNVAASEGSRFLLELNAKEGYAASIWHTDLTFLAAYPEASILRAIVVPDFGGDTLWANTAAAYSDLPAPLRILVDNLHAIHADATDFDLYQVSVKDQLGAAQNGPALVRFEAEHPVVRVHPETGERCLVLGQSRVKRFVGLNALDSQRLLAILQDQVTRPENTVRWRWQPGDVAIWDNRATQHRSVPDYGDQPRQMRRATIHGTTAIGIDGFESRQIPLVGN